MVGELEAEVGDFQELFRPFLAGAGECDKVFCCRLALLHSEDFESSASEVHDLILLGRMRNFRPFSLDSHLAWLSLGISGL